MSESLSIWTVYDHPADFPTKFVARRWEIRGGPEPIWTSEHVTADSLAGIRCFMEAHGLYRIDRMRGDEPKIVEVWL